MPERLIQLAAALSLGVSVSLFVWLIYRIQQTVADASVTEDQRRSRIESPVFRLLIPMCQPIASSLSALALRAEKQEAVTGKSSWLIQTRRRLRRTLIAAGHPEGVTPDEFLGLVVLAILFSLAIGWLVYAMLAQLDRLLGEPLGEVGPGVCLLLALALGLLFCFLPLLWLRDRLKTRTLAIMKALPYTLDLLTLSVEAGLDFTAALARIVQKLGPRSPLGQELGQMLREIQVGKDRSDALRDMGERIDLQELTTVCSSLIQADELGASLGPILRIQSEQLRVRRSQRAETLAMQAPVKMLFPLVFFIFPTIFVMITAIVYLQLRSMNVL